MNIYAIYLFEGNITLHEFIGEKTSLLKNMGEVSQRFEFDPFWSWWKKKVDYQHEDEFAFVIFTDQIQFLIPEDISIAKTVNLSDLKGVLKLLYKLPSNTNIVTKPESMPLDRTVQEIPKQKTSKMPFNNNSLEDYFVKETLRFKSGN